MKTILLSQGSYAIVDDSDFHLVSKLNWHLNKKTNVHLYAKSSKKINGKQIHMHRLIMNANKGEEVDHINHNGLDNRRSNLRIVNSFQNHQNSKKQINSASIYKGISYAKDHKKWRARIWVDGKKIHLGYFKNEIDAAKAYDRAALKYYSEYAYINFNRK